MTSALFKIHQPWSCLGRHFRAIIYDQKIVLARCVGRQHFEFSGKLREMSERSNVVIRRIWTSWERIIRGALARVPDKRIYAYIPCTRPSFGINRHSRQFWIKGQLRTILANAHTPPRLFAKGSIESTHKVPTSHYLRKGQLNRPNRHTRSQLTSDKVPGTDQPLPHETLPRSGRVTRWTNTPVRIFKDPAPTPTAICVKVSFCCLIHTRDVERSR